MNEIQQAKINASSDYYMSRLVKHAAARGLQFRDPEHAAQGALLGHGLAEGRPAGVVKRASAEQRIPLVADQDDQAGMVKLAHFIEAVAASK